MRFLCLATLAGCGAPIYFPSEPAPPERALGATGSTGDTGGPATPTTPTTPTSPPGTPTADGLPCSVSGGASAELTIRNRGYETLSLIWRDTACGEWPIGPLYPSGESVQETWVGHAFVVRDRYGNALGSHVVDEASGVWEAP